MKKLSSNLLSCITICLLLLASFQSRADRAAAGEIGYAFLRVDSTINRVDSTILRVDTTKSPGGVITKLDTVYNYDTTFNYLDVYRVTYKFYKDCGGATSEPSDVRVCYYNTCNTDKGSVLLPKKTPLTSNGLVVNASCGGTSLTTCTGGTTRGYKEWIYEGVVSLPSKCASWHLWVSLGSRNATITNYAASAAGNNLYTETTLNNVDAANSSSPSFTLAPIQYMCNGEKQNYSFAAFDADGDELTYALVDPATANDNQTSCPATVAATSFAFGGTSPGTALATNPFATTGTFMLNSATGEMSFTPSSATDQLAQLCLLVTKTRGGKVVGTMMREMQFVISTACGASSPLTFTQDPKRMVLVLPPDTNLVCPNVEHEICFDLASPDPGTSIFISGDNHLTFSETSNTSVLTYVNQNTNKVTGCFVWTPDTVDEGTKMLIVNSTICKPGQPNLYRKDTIKIFTAYTVHASKDDTICMFESSHVCVIGGALDSFEWAITNPPGSGITTGTLGIATPNDSMCTVVTPGQTIVYLVTAKDRYNGCKRKDIPALNTNQDEVKIVVVDPRINAGPDTTMCVYSKLQLNSNLINPQPEMTYSYRWTPGTYMDDSTITNPTLSIPKGTRSEDVPDSITYYITVIPSATRCARTDTIVVYFMKGFYILTGDSLGDNTGYAFQGRQKGVSDTAICAGQSIRLVGWVDSKPNRRYDLSWTPTTGVSTPTGFATGMTITPTGTGLKTYTLTAQKSGCPDSSKKVNIMVEPNPTVNIGPDRTICFGDTINLAAEITPDANTFTEYTYAWSPGGAIARPDTFITYFTGYVTQNVTLTVKTPAGCTGTDMALYRVELRKFLTVSPTDTMICPGDKAYLHVVGDPLLDKVTWRPAGTIDSVNSLNPIATPEYTTDYVVVGVDENKCVDSGIVRVTVLPRAVIYLEDSVTIYPGDEYQMTPEGNGMYYTWFPAVGLDDANISNPKASPLLNTTYYLTAKTEAGCTAYDSIYVFVAPDSHIDVPNAFVPGGGENGRFRILHLGDATLTSFTIYNRWGNKVFSTNNLEEGWDGAFGGQPQPMGVYVYVIEAMTAKGRKIMKQGNVTLIR